MSQGNGLAGGVVKYYAGGWQEFGVTDANGVTEILLPPGTYKFRMTYANASVQRQQDIGADPTVVFQTGQVVSDSGTCTHYYAGGWQVFVDGMELLPGTYPFRFDDGTPDTEFGVQAATINHIH